MPGYPTSRGVDLAPIAKVVAEAVMNLNTHAVAAQLAVLTPFEAAALVPLVLQELTDERAQTVFVGMVENLATP